MIGLGGALSALLFFYAASGLPLSFVAQIAITIPLFLVGLSKGIRALVMSVLIALFFVSIGVSPLGISYYALYYLGPTLLLTHRVLLSRPLNEPQHREWYPLGHLLSWMGGYFCLMLVFNYFLFAPKVTAVDTQTLVPGALLNSGLSSEALAQVQAMLGFLIKHYPAMASCAMLVWTLVGAFFAQRLLERFSHHIRPSSTVEIALPWGVWVAFAFFLALTILSRDFFLQDLFIDLVLVISFLFLMDGLNFVHQFCKKNQKRHLFLWIFYFIVIMFPWLLIAVIMLSIFDPWLNLRQRVLEN